MQIMKQKQIVGMRIKITTDVRQSFFHAMK
jgi:hypothetical protein